MGYIFASVAENRTLILEGKKRCTKCKLIKILEDYTPHKPSMGGRLSMCKICNGAIQRKARKAKRGQPQQKFIEQLGTARKAAKQCGVENTLTVQEWIDKLSEYAIKGGHACHICGDRIDAIFAVKMRELVMEHMTPMSKGGANSKENVAPAHRFCNNAKSNLNMDEFRTFCQKVLS